ncbi:hypothetical protein RD110_23730 [Rhodoferax koreense]|uniref:Alpha-1,2-fucosyltransferase n=1 Tax=Rhodoferax koreensis TaxID=1842727 RepID=A0A1P8K1G0_9BURK|nr:alpha-1,2-fucosyltransferase [Rhodoferax koreense]APW39840.1 hypothetical protein RD110_23730 [Rhodoferax koreense]
MIAFSKLGTLGRLGNQLFQYAFLRTTARRLGVPFYCPPWQGDEIFELNDASERATTCEPMKHRFVEPYANTGFNPHALQIVDETEMQGYFQTPKYFDERSVKQWFRFKPEPVAAVAQKYASLDFANSVGLHLRLGDFVTTFANFFYVATPDYYRKAVERVPHKQNVIVFSDDIAGARAILKDLGRPLVFIEDNAAHEDLYLQTLCRDFICSPSTYSWWGAWLNAYPDKTIIAPAEGLFRPGSPLNNKEFWPPEWPKIKALRGLRDHHFIFTREKKLVHKLRRAIEITKGSFDRK